MYTVFTRMPVVYVHCIYTHASSLCTLYLHACQVSYRRRLGLCCCTCVTYFERKLTHLLIDSARALWASFCFRLVLFSLFKHHIPIKVLFTMYSVAASWPADIKNKLYNNFALHCLSYAYISQSEPRTSYQYKLVNGKPPQQQFSSAEFKIIIYAIGKPICAPSISLKFP